MLLFLVFWGFARVWALPVSLHQVSCLWPASVYPLGSWCGVCVCARACRLCVRAGHSSGLVSACTSVFTSCPYPLVPPVPSCLHLCVRCVQILWVGSSVKHVDGLSPGSSTTLTFMAAVPCPGLYDINQFVVEVVGRSGGAAPPTPFRLPGTHTVEVLAASS